MSCHPRGKELNRPGLLEFFTIGTPTPWSHRWNHLIPGRGSSLGKIRISGTTGIPSPIPVRWRSQYCDVSGESQLTRPSFIEIYVDFWGPNKWAHPKFVAFLCISCKEGRSFSNMLEFRGCADLWTIPSMLHNAIMHHNALANSCVCRLFTANGVPHSRF